MSAAGSSRFVDRVEEMSRITDSLKLVSTGKGQLLLIRGEAGSGKTRLVQEAAAECEKQGFSIGFGTALAESVVPYRAWKEVLEGLGLDAILEEAPPPKLLGLYLLTGEGRDMVRVEREGIDDGRLASSVDILKEYVQGSLDSKDCKWAEGQLAVMQEDSNRIVVAEDANFTIGAVLEGQEDEKFLADLQALTSTTTSMGPDLRLDADFAATEVPLRELLESRKYEGIDYVQDDPKLRQARFFGQVTLGLSRKASVSPVLVVFDDLQWADPSSLDLLRYVARNTREASVLLMGTYRIEEAESRPHLRGALRGMEEEDLVTEMDLKGLAQRDLADLAESFIGSHSLPETFIDRLWRETRGNPLFVREVLRGLEEDSVITQKGGVKRLDRPIDQLALPERVREVIRTRLERLPEEDRRLLDAAATCGTRFTAALISKITGETKGNVLNGLNSIAQVHGLLRPSGSGFTFDHSAVQEVIYDNVPIETRQTYHRGAAEWLELAGGPLEDVAEHYYRSGSPIAVPKLRAAAEAALARYANSEAARLLGEALELVATEEKGEILELQADALEAGACYDEALSALDEALQIGASLARCKRKVASVLIHQGLFDDALAACEDGLAESEGSERGRLLIARGEALLRKGEYSAAVEQVQTALGIFGEEGDPRDRANALDTIGMVHLFEGRYEEAERVLLKVLADRELTDDRRAMGKSLNALGNVLLRRGDYGRAMEYYMKALRTREAIGDLNGVSASLSNTGNIYIKQGDLSRALEFYQEALGISEAIGNRLWIANQTNNVAAVYYHLGDLDQAIEFYERSFEMKEATGNPEGSVRTLINLGMVHRMRGDLEKTFECYQKSLSRSEEMGNKECIAASLTGLGTVYGDREDFPSALKMLNRAVAVSEELGSAVCHAEVLDALAPALVHSGNLEEARKRAKEHLAIARESSMRPEEANALHNLARCETASGHPDEARRGFSRAIQLFEEQEADLDMANCHFEWGLAERDWGNETVARDHLQKALELFQLRNLAVMVDKAREALEAPDVEA